MSTSTLLDKTPAPAKSDGVVVTLKGHITASSKISSRIAPLIESFLSAAGLNGNFTFRITGPNDCVNYQAEDWIRIRLEGNGGSCGMIVRLGSNNHRYGGYLDSQSGHRPQYLHTVLSRYTEKGFWQPSRPVHQKAKTVEASCMGDSKLEVLSPQAVVAPTVVASPEVQPAGQVVTEAADTTPEASSPTLDQQYESIIGMSDDIEMLKLIKMAIHELYPSGRAPIKGLSLRIVGKLGLKTRAHAVGPILRAMVNRGLMKLNADESQYELTPDEPGAHSPASPAVSEKAPPSAASSQPAPTVQSQIDPTSMFAQMEVMIKMAREYGQAFDKSGQVAAKLETLKANIASKETELNALKEQHAALEVERTEVSRILNSEPHKRARALLAQMRDMSVS